MEGIIDTYAAKVGMTKYLDHEPTHLSGGQKQRVAIAGVLAMKPKILIFDEATSMLDPQGRQEIRRVTKQLHEDRGLTILSITHDIDEVASSDQVIVMAGGRCVMQGTPAEIFRQEKKLKEIQLDIPFSLKLQEALRKRGVVLPRDLTIDSLLEDLCQYSSNM